MKRQAIVFAAAFALCACDAPPPVGAASIGFPHDCTLQTDAEHAELVADAAAQWSGYCFDIGVEIIEEPTRAEHNVRFIDAFPGQGPGSTGAIEIYEGEARRQGIQLFPIVLHEIGHHYGLKHSSNMVDVMSTEDGVWPTELSEGDVDALLDLCERKVAKAKANSESKDD